MASRISAVDGDRRDRGHEALPHTADVGLRGWGPTAAAAFEEAGAALAELTAEFVAPEGVHRARREAIALEAHDLVGLAYAWLNELVALVDIHGAIADVEIASIERTTDDWRLRGRVGLAPFDGQVVRRRADVKSATYHGLSVVDDDGAWTLTAYIDV